MSGLPQFGPCVAIRTFASKGTDGNEYGVRRGEVWKYEHPVVQANPGLFIHWPASEAEILQVEQALDAEVAGRNDPTEIVNVLFSTTTTDSDPGSGHFRLSNATQKLSTTLRLHTADLPETLVDGAALKLLAWDGSGGYLQFRAGALSPQSGYTNVTLTTLLDFSGSSPFTNGMNVGLEV